ncbi:MAG: DUF4294 domain-containing protein [Paludibacteraceae bacterium]|nr:DUF4294 domain-containing protein [Paludibacteraceae bacterium]
MKPQQGDKNILMMQVINGDTILWSTIPEVYVYPKMKFKNKRQEKFYWRTVRDVKKTLPYARMIAADMRYADQEMAKLSTRKEKKTWWRKFEKYLFKKYEDDFRGMYASQGRMLMLLLARESNTTSYELIREYKNKATADFWQGIAKLFRNDLKEDYDGNDKDKIIERVITLVEAGQL